MPENTKRSDYQCETPKNWITGRLFSKVVGGGGGGGGTSDRIGQNSLKLVHSLLKSGQDRKIDQK